MTPDTARSFYRTALLALLAQEQHDPTSRRFGADADAAWSIFQGHLDASDRVDMLLRDAAVKHPAAFAPRTVFSGDPALSAGYLTTDLPEDEPFGPNWLSPYGPDTGRQLWTEVLGWQSEPMEQLWKRVLTAWGIAEDESAATPELDATSRLLVVGDPSIATLAKRFLNDTNLDWGRQVVAAASTPAGIQLSGVVPVMTGTQTAARVIGLNGDLDVALQALEDWRPDSTLEPKQPTELESAFLAAIRNPA